MDIYVDGSCSRIAYIIDDTAPMICPLKTKRTNNEGEYLAVLIALTALITAGFYDGTDIEIYSDSQLIVNQLNGKYKIHKPELQDLHDKVMDLSGSISSKVKVTWVPRELNKAGWLLEG